MTAIGAVVFYNLSLPAVDTSVGPFDMVTVEIEHL
jgi:hypothetical protein